MMLLPVAAGPRSPGELSSRVLELAFSPTVHAPDTWLEGFQELASIAPQVRAALCPRGRFGLGLRLPYEYSRTLSDPLVLGRFARWLLSHGFHTSLVNGFDFGHNGTREPVKEAIFAPDWRFEERVQYTVRLARLLERLPHGGADAGVSTVPLSYHPWVARDDEEAWARMTHNVCRVADVLVRIHQQSGRLIHLDLEPEPNGLLSSTDDVIHFFERWLLPIGAPMLAARFGIDDGGAREMLLAHVQVCLDACHFAILFEEPVDVAARLSERGIRIGRVQLSSALRVPLPQGDRSDMQRALAVCAEPIWLHEAVLIDGDGRRRRFSDLPNALVALCDPRFVELRAHVHLPLTAERHGAFESTQSGVKALIASVVADGFTRHLEVEAEDDLRWALEQLLPRPALSPTA